MRNFLVVLACICALWAQSGPAAAQQKEETPPATQPAYALKGADTCLKCHDKGSVLDVLRGPHAMKGDARTPFAAHACESCHGASPEHLVKPKDGEPRALPAVVYGKNSKNTTEERNAVCLGCHQGNNRMNWKGSAHHRQDVDCVSCHDMHTTKDAVLRKETQPQVCITCHVEQRAQLHRPSRHPIKEGQTACSDCHNPHGSPTDKSLVGRTVNDTCYQCHAEKRGPFLWEHSPVRENCTTCHSPHGTTQPRLLNTRVPFLCQQCHQSGHSSTFLSGNTATTAKTLYGAACLNCHSQIHGSNHPSGARFVK